MQRQISLTRKSRFRSLHHWCIEQTWDFGSGLMEQPVTAWDIRTKQSGRLCRIFPDSVQTRHQKGTGRLTRCYFQSWSVVRKCKYSEWWHILIGCIFSYFHDTFLFYCSPVRIWVHIIKHELWQYCTSACPSARFLKLKNQLVIATWRKHTESERSELLITSYHVLWCPLKRLFEWQLTEPKANSILSHTNFTLSMRKHIEQVSANKNINFPDVQKCRNLEYILQHLYTLTIWENITTLHSVRAKHERVVKSALLSWWFFSCYSPL